MCFEIMLKSQPVCIPIGFVDLLLKYAIYNKLQCDLFIICMCRFLNTVKMIKIIEILGITNISSFDCDAKY